MNKLFITTEGLPLPESVNHYTKIRVVRGIPMKYKTAKAKKFEKEFTEYLDNLVKETGWTYDEDSKEHYYLDMVIYFDKRGSDSSNRDKQVLDCMNGRLFPDDKYVHPRIQAVYIDPNNPRIEMHLHKVKYTGIFNNEDDKNNFITQNCSTCSRFRNGACGILKDALEGRFKEELTYTSKLDHNQNLMHTDYVCKGYKKRVEK